MVFFYKENPLETEIILDGNELKLLKTKIELDYFQDLNIEIQVRIINNEEVLSNDHNLFPDWDIDQEYKEYINKTYNLYIKELRESHKGDCTCLPITCIKCMAESLLDISTIDDLNRYIGYEIIQVFREDDINTCKEAIEYFKTRNNIQAIEYLENHQQRIDKTNDNRS